MATVLPGMRPSVPSSKVELRIRCAHLLDRDVTSKSDPCAVMFMQEANGRWYEVGQRKRGQRHKSSHSTQSLCVCVCVCVVSNKSKSLLGRGQAH